MEKDRIIFYKKLKKEIDVVLIFAKYKNKWLLTKHKNRNTWEVCGGHLEDGENIFEAAKRELYEESGATTKDLVLVGYYSFINKGLTKYGAVFTCDVIKLSTLPNYEMKEICLMEKFPLNNTYPLTYKRLLREVCDYNEKCI